jgi:hypothetical protein
MKLSVLVFSALVSLTTSFAHGALNSGEWHDRTSWIEKLRDDFQVEIVEDAPSLFDTDFLMYLHSFFSASPKPRLPIHLHATLKSGAKKTWRRDQSKDAIDLYFTADAGSGLYSKGESAPKELPDGRTEITVDYNSDLYLQLTDVLFPLRDLQRSLLETYHIATDCRGVTDPCDTFKKHEFLAILGILQDLPSGLRQSLRLNRMIRQPDGVSTLGNLAAVADYSNGVIRVTGRAFSTDGDRLGEGTLVHEMAHALWPALPYSLRQGFIDLSWTEDPDTGAIILKSGDHDFVSEYSLSKPEEDFAEHFSAYFNQPEQLKSLAPVKREWLKENIFVDTEYYSAAASNAKIYIHSSTPDVTAPWFAGDPLKNIEISARVQGKTVEVRIRLKNLVDDLSGLRRADLTFESIEKKGAGGAGMDFELDAASTRQDRPDEYLLVKILDRSKLSSKKLYLSHIRIEDHAGNRDYVLLQDKGISLELEGTATDEELAKNSLFYESARQSRLSREINRNLEPFQSEVKLSEGPAQGLYTLHLPRQVDEQKVKLVGV